MATQLIFRKVILFLSLILPLLGVAYATGAERLTVSEQRVAVKNNFVTNLLKLRQSLLDKHAVTNKTRTGGYANYPDYYLEETSFYKNTDRVLSVVQREKANPENLHALEVYLYDAQDRVMRDYSASFLPNAHNAPVQTLISLHIYNGKYHAFRTFDAFGTRLYERCERGDEILMQFDADAIEDRLHGANSPANTELYQSCFKNLAEAANEYLTPH